LTGAAGFFLTINGLASTLSGTAKFWAKATGAAALTAKDLVAKAAAGAAANDLVAKAAAGAAANDLVTKGAAA
jgi:hypothetical protein